MKTNRIRTVFVLLSGVISFLGMQCSPTSTDHADTPTPTGAGMIAGVIYNNDGTFARDAKVTLQKKKSLSDTSGILSKKLAVPDTAVSITNDSGKFVIASIDTGVYVVVGTDGGNNLSQNDSVPVKSKDSTIILPPDTLKPAGAIKGVINLSEGGDSRKVLVLAFGVDKIVKVNADGSFKISSLAEGKYDLRLISTLDNYGILDTTNIRVTSADTTSLDTIQMPYSGVPTPSGLKISYDSLNQIVTLTWRVPKTGTKVQSYNIFRKNNDSTNFINIKSGLTDTTFIDSVVFPDQIFKYGIVAIDTNNRTGTMSVTASVTIGTYFQLDTSISGPSNFGGITGNRSGTFYVSGDNKIQIFDNKMAIKFEIDSPKVITPLGIEVDSLGNIYSYNNLDNDNKTIIVFSPTGVLTNNIVVGNKAGNGAKGVHDFCIQQNQLFGISGYFYYSYPTIDTISVVVMDLQGAVQRSWAISDYCSISSSNSNEIFLTNLNSIQVYDTLGNQKFLIAPKSFQPSGKVVFDSKGRMIVVNFTPISGLVTQPELWFFDNKGNYLAKYKLQNRIGPDISLGGMCATFFQGNDFIYVVLSGGDSSKILKISNLLP